MKILVAGATGAIGRPLVRRLVEQGHEVTGLTRRPGRVAALEALGARGAVADVLDRAAVESVVAAARPEIVVAQLTDLPARVDPKQLKGAYEGNDRVRSEGTANVVEAGRRAGARRVVAQSIAFWYRPEPGGGPADESAPLWVDAPAPLSSSVAALEAMERSVLGSGLEAVILRYGFFYGPGTWYAPDGFITELVRKRRFPLVGGGRGVASYIHIDDAAEATAAAVTRGSGIYNVVDDEPAAMHEWLPAFAAAVGAKPPRRAPAFLARLMAGPAIVAQATQFRGASNARAKADLGWAPRWPSWRQGFREALG